MRAGLAACIVLALAACASTPPSPVRPPESSSSPGGANGASGASRVARNPAELFVSDALALLGQPYRYGGNEPGGFDCSGLVQYAASGAGIWVPRTAHEQLGFGRPITRRELRAGDLVFLHLAHKELHVGIALGGDRFVHAPSTGGYIRIDSLARTPYAKGFIGARRIVDAPAAPAAPARTAPSTGAAPEPGVQ